jgi:hypothetical protein
LDPFFSYRGREKEIKQWEKIKSDKVMKKEQGWDLENFLKTSYELS